MLQDTDELIRKLKSRNINVHRVRNRDEAIATIIEMIPSGSKIGYGGSVTLEEIGVFDKLKDQLLDKGDKDFYHQCLLAEWYLSGANAITKDGKIVNVDGRSNRVAAISFGPKKVIIVAGKNKLVLDEEAARKRIMDVAIPKNLERLRKMGKTEWNADNMWCNLSIIERQKENDRMHVILVDEELGF